MFRQGFASLTTREGKGREAGKGKRVKRIPKVIECKLTKKNEIEQKKVIDFKFTQEMA